MSSCLSPACAVCSFWPYRSAVQLDVPVVRGGKHLDRLTFQTTKPIGVESANLVFNPGSAVIIEGLDAAPEWNGTRGLVESFDETKGYFVLIKGRTKPLRVKVACCKLEFAAKQEHEATRRARVEANVRAALAERAEQKELEK
eukprot:COSAG06_NODE_1767_length_8434_cov_3.008158_7_plen_143_part_00